MAKEKRVGDNNPITTIDIFVITVYYYEQTMELGLEVLKLLDVLLTQF